jgi:hypothetical protein
LANSLIDEIPENAQAENHTRVGVKGGGNIILFEAETELLCSGVQVFEPYISRKTPDPEIHIGSYIRPVLGVK